MKTVTGGLIAAKPISLPKASKLLSSFVCSENGASQAVGAYLRRASTAFSELKSLHVELKSDERSQEINEVKKKKKKSKDIIEDDESFVAGNVTRKLKVCDKVMEVETGNENENENENEGRKEKKKKRKISRNGFSGEGEQSIVEVGCFGHFS